VERMTKASLILKQPTATAADAYSEDGNMRTKQFLSHDGKPTKWERRRRLTGFPLGHMYNLLTLFGYFFCVKLTWGNPAACHARRQAFSNVLQSVHAGLEFVEKNCPTEECIEKDCCS
jgi:hypothetical protein